MIRDAETVSLRQDRQCWLKKLRGIPKWLPGKIVEKTGPLSYRAQVQGQIWRRHTDQLLATGDLESVIDCQPNEIVDLKMPSNEVLPSGESDPSTEPVETNVPESVNDARPNSFPRVVSRYPHRDHKVTERLICEYQNKLGGNVMY